MTITLLTLHGTTLRFTISTAAYYGRHPSSRDEARWAMGRAQTPTLRTRYLNNQRRFEFGDSVSNEVVSATGKLIESVHVFYFNGEIISLTSIPFFFISSTIWNRTLLTPFRVKLDFRRSFQLATSRASIKIAPQ